MELFFKSYVSDNLSPKITLTFKLFREVIIAISGDFSFLPGDMNFNIAAEMLNHLT